MKLIITKTKSLMICVILLSAMLINNLGLNLKRLKRHESTSHIKSEKSSGPAVDNTLLGGGTARWCMKALTDSLAPDFCWKKGGDVGIIPKGCPPGYFRHLALCYVRCEGKYTYNGAGLCKDGAKTYIPKSITNFSDRATCPQGYYKGGALCYKDCENIGMFNCGIGACSMNKAGCAMQIVLMTVDTILGAVQFVAFVLSFGASSAVAPEVNTGRQAVSKLSSEALKMAWTRVQASLGTFFKQTVDRAKKAFIDTIKGLPVGLTASWVAENVCGELYKKVAKEVTGKSQPTSTSPVDILKKFDVFGIAPIVDNCKDPKKKELCAKSVLSAASTFDPTGLLAIAAAFVHPTCEIPIPDNTKVDPKTIQNKPRSICTKCLEMTKTSEDYGQGRVHFLDRHNVECPAGSALNYVYFDAKPKDAKIGVDYRCIKDSSITTTCKDQFTPWGNFKSNEGSLQFLDLHNVECSDKNYVLQGFKLEAKEKENKMRFSYRCCMIKGDYYTWNYRTMPTQATSKWTTDSFNSSDALDAGSNGAFRGFKLSRSDPNKFWFDYAVSTPTETNTSVYTSQTPSKDAGKGSIWYLDRHRVACDNHNSAIRAFWYQRDGDKMNYIVECVKNPKISNICQTRLTKFSDVDWDEFSSIHFLDRQVIMCNADESMKSFQMQRVDNRLRYTMDCCKTEYVSSSTTRWEKTDLGGKQNYVLDKQRVFLGADEALRGFWMEVSWNPDLVWYAWQANVLN